MEDNKLVSESIREVSRLRHRGVDPVIEAQAERVIGAAIEVHRALGPGYSEALYERALSIELTHRGLPHVCQHPFRVHYRGEVIGEGRVDIFVNNELIVELKAVEALSEAHEAQVVAYLKANQKRLGLLINFNEALLKDGLKRVIH